MPPQVRLSMSLIPVSPAARLRNGPTLFAALPELRMIPEVAEAVEKIYGVKVKSVNMLNYRGKKKRSGRSPMPGPRRPRPG